MPDEPASPPPEATPLVAENDSMRTPSTRKNRLGIRLFFTGVAFFAGALLLSAILFLSGGNTISGANIGFAINGPTSVGGGEELPLTVSVTNRNRVPIESATLIINFPDGTQAASESQTALDTARIPLDRIGPNQTVNVPVRAVLYGEENEEQVITTTLEYRVDGSNAIFSTNEQSYTVRIGTSPVNLSIESVERVAAGQTTEFSFEVTSNTSETIEDLLVIAEYPVGFQVTETSRTPDVGSRTWKFESLEPEERKTITVRGVMSGEVAEEQTLRVSAGVPNADAEYELASVFANTTHNIAIEEPFVRLQIAAEDAAGDVITVAPGETRTVRVAVENTLDTAIYDLVVELALSGNAVQSANISAAGGRYNARTQTIRYDAQSREQFAEFAPGARATLTFNFTAPPGGSASPQVNLEASAFAKRVREAGVSESLVGSDRASVRIASGIALQTATLYDDGPFRNDGPVPPVVNNTTNYTLRLTVNNGSNDLANTEITATLPSYVTWTGNAVGDGEITYDESSRLIRWRRGGVDANQTSAAYVQVALNPTADQAQRAPKLLTDVVLRGLDRFTQQRVEVSGDDISTNIDGRRRSGIVQSSLAN